MFFLILFIFWAKLVRTHVQKQTGGRQDKEQKVSFN